MDMKIELVPVPVSDTDVAKDFYTNKVGFTADHDHRVNENLRFVQLTPPGSACSIVIGEGITEMAVGSQNIQMVVKDAREARTKLIANGVEASEIQELPWGTLHSFPIRMAIGGRFSRSIQLNKALSDTSQLLSAKDLLKSLPRSVQLP